MLLGGKPENMMAGFRQSFRAHTPGAYALDRGYSDPEPIQKAHDDTGVNDAITVYNFYPVPRVRGEVGRGCKHP
jgi:hypothetical protein